ncbi:hypothetical protein Tco_0439181 [Tanacetum coccineum]
MAEESGSAEVIVVPKFDMRCHESLMTAKDVKKLGRKYNVPLDLQPCATMVVWMMDQLPEDLIGLYEQFFEYSGLRVPFSTLLLGVIKHFRVHISQLVHLELNRLTMFELYCRSLGIMPTVSLFRVFYKISKQGHWTSGVLRRRLLIFRPVPPGLLFGAGLATTWDFLGFFPVFKDTRGNVVIMSKYLRFPFLSGISIMQGAVVPANHSVEVEDPKVVAAREKKRAQVARTAVKKKESRKKGNNEEGSSKAKKKKIPAGVKSASKNSNHVSSPSFTDVSESVHHFVNVEEKQGRNVEEGESSRSDSVYIPGWAIPRRCHADNHEWAWFSVARGAMAQTDLLKRFENLLADYDTLVETHSECSKTALKEEHTGCEQKVKALEEERNNLSVVNRDQALWIKELEVGVAKKDYALAAAEQVSTEGAQERQKLVAQLSKTEVEKKLYPMYDKLFEKECPYFEKIASGYRHSVVDLLKVHLDPAHSEGTLTPTISKALGVSCAYPLQKKT